MILHCGYFRGALSDTFSAAEMEHLRYVVANAEGDFPLPMREFAAALLESIGQEHGGSDGGKNWMSSSGGVKGHVRGRRAGKV